MLMKILLVSQYFWPETFIINEFITCLISQGHTIEVFTGKPNYPDGVIFEGYSAKKCTKETFNEKVTVHRVPLYPRGKGGAKRLLLNYLSFVLSGLLYFYRQAKSQQFDVILVYIPSPITAVIPAIYLKKRLKLPLAVWVQDLWPESLSATGFVKNSFLLKLVGKLVRWIYASSDLLLLQSEAFKKPMLQYAAADKLVYYPNSYLEPAIDNSQEALLSKELMSNLDNNFCIVFAGNLGTAQSIATIVEAAERLKNLVHCQLILVGSGSLSNWIKQQISEKKLTNLILAGRFPSTVMPFIFNRAAGLLVTLKRDEIFSYTIPCKIQSYLAAGRPIIAALNGEGGRIIHEAGAGFVGSAEDAEVLAKNIEQLYYMSELDREKLGQSGRAYFLKHFEMQSQSRRLIEIFEERLSQQGAV